MAVLRFIVSCAILGILAMLYWSSLLVEEDLKGIKAELQGLKNRPLASSATSTVTNADKVELKREHINSAFPNILEEDPFYAKTLPEMLGADFTPWGTRKSATIGKPANLHPFAQWADVAAWQGLCSVTVGKTKFGFYEKYCPSAAMKVEERKVEGSNDIEYWVHLRDDMWWQPLAQDWFPSQIKLDEHFLEKRKVTAFDFKLQFDLVMNPFITAPSAVVEREFFADVVDFRILDDYTFVIRWKTHPITENGGEVVHKSQYRAKLLTISLSPIASFVYLYYPDGKKIVEKDEDPATYRTNSTFAQTFMEHWAKNVIPSCGPMKFDGWSDQMIKFKRNPDHFAPLECLVLGSEYEFRQTGENVWLAFKQVMTDSYILQPDHHLEFKNFMQSESYLQQVKQGLEIHRLDYVSRMYFYIGWNEARPLFRNKKVRRAMTLAIDRKRIVDRIMNGMGIEMSSPFYPYSSAYDNSIKPLPYDPVLAKRLLEEEGFADLDGDGYLEKKQDDEILKFEFSLTYFVKDATTKAIAEYVATALKEIGVKCNLNGVDIADLSLIFDDKNFDAYYLGWGLANPPEDLRQIWHSSGAKEKGSSNAIGFANPEVDKIVEALEYEYDPEKRKELYHKFDAIFADEVPYTLMFTPKIALLYRDFLQNVFLPVERQDLIPGAVVGEPQPPIFWLKQIKE